MKMEYKYLTQDLREAAIVDRRKELEASFFRVDLDKQIGTKLGTDTSGLEARLVALDSEAAALDEVTSIPVKG